VRNLDVAAVRLVQPERLDDMDVRWEYTGHFSFAIPTGEALDVIADVSPTGVIEEAAGGGYWATLLRARGVPRVHAFDSHPLASPVQPAFATRIPNEYNQFISHSWGGVGLGIAGASAAHPDLTLMLCWPPERDHTALMALDSYEGDTLVYVGELPEDVDDRQPHMADPLFFRRLRLGWRQIGRVEIPQWQVPADGEHDSLTVWKRNPTTTFTGSV
jgi:hypothetical protein